VLAAAAVVAVVVAVVVGVSAVGGANRPTDPPVLHLASVADGLPGLSALPAAGVSGKGGASGSSPAGSRWRLEGTLPDGPSSGQVYLLPAGASSRAVVATLARALGMSGQLQHLKGGWYLVSGSTELSVSELAGRHWTYGNHGCIAGPVFNPQTGTACAVATSVPPIPRESPASGAPGGRGPNPTPTASTQVAVATPLPVPEGLARSLARPVLEAVSVNPSSARVETAGGQRSIVFNPQVAGSTVPGLETRVTMDEHGQIVDAFGWLATSTTGATYPLISARQGFNQLRAQPQPMMALGLMCRRVPGTQGCAPVPDRVVTGARLGLTQAYSTDRGVLLVPAWLFQVRGEPTPLAVVAVAGAFQGEPGQQPSLGGEPTVRSVPGSIGGGSGTNGSTQRTGAPTQVEPSDPTAGSAPTPAR
jgi:hypothetical protein